MLSTSPLKIWRGHIRGNVEEDQRQFSAAYCRAYTDRSRNHATKLRRPPSPFYLFIHHSEYRKWASSNIILRFSIILPARFKNRMRKRIMKHRGVASRLAQERDAVIAQLTRPAREIFEELEALYKSPCTAKRKR